MGSSETRPRGFSGAVGTAAPIDALPRGWSGIHEPNGLTVQGLHAALRTAPVPIAWPLLVTTIVAVVLVVQGRTHQSPVAGSPPGDRRGRRFS